MGNQSPQSLYSAFYILNREEKEIFNVTLFNNVDNIRHGMFILFLYKEVNYDLSTLFRIINTGVAEKSISKTVLTSIKNLVKEVIVLSNYNKHLEDGIINMVRLSRLERFSIAGITRIFILRTLQKYKVEYKTYKDIIKIDTY